MTAGRPRKPLERAAVLAKGDGRTPGGRVLQGSVTNAPERRADAPAPCISLGERGQAEWRKLWDSCWWLHPDRDYHLVEQICTAYDELEVYRLRILEDGLMVKGSMGQDTAHPLINERRKLEASIRQNLSLLGNTPTDRAKLNLTEAQTASKLQQMMNRGRQ